MRYLLDTHVFVWLALDPDRLSPALRGALASLRNDVRLSAVSAFEIALKVRLGKFASAAPLSRTLPKVAAAMGVEPLSVDLGHAELAGAMRWDHRDPFDRLLVAQAVAEDCVLVTNDRAIAAAALPGLRTAW